MRQQLSRKCFELCLHVTSFVLLVIRLFPSYTLIHTEYAHLYTLTYTIYVHTCQQNMKQYTPPYSATTFYHGRPLWFNNDGHFDCMLICSRRILNTHMELGSSYLETYVRCQHRLFYDNWLGSYYPLYITKVFWRPSLIAKFPRMGFLGTFSMSFYIICWTDSEKFSLLRIYLVLNIMVLDYLGYLRQELDQY